MSRHVPRQRIGIEELGARLGLTPSRVRLYERLFGLKWFPYETGSTATDLMLASASGLTQLREREKDIRYVVLGRAIEFAAPYPLMHVQEVVRSLSLEHTTAFTVTQHSCATGLLAVSLAGRLLAADPDPRALALVLTGEKAFSPTVQLLSDITINSEGTAAALIASSADHDSLIGSATKIYGRRSDYVPALAQIILDAVDSAKLTLDDIALILPHNVNRFTWKKVCALLGIPLDRVFLDNVPTMGHSFCADAFLNYLDARDGGRLNDGDRYVMAAAGLGGTYSAMVFTH
ncbi:3-oxoacyl-[acyl-carrier-protein] synthase III C-terminal domain-containing protein [Nonomuraea fuscirosea]|uniref:3-oxoacyl-[acyl-carrier-protein] synthase III C-terminal domain-containing protein n=1 Tax=Nonomuraea fuscirosea TaxID=1291556 RepID=UPI00346CD55A